MRRDLLVPNRAERRLLRRMPPRHQRANFLDEPGLDHRVEARINSLVELLPLDLDSYGQRFVSALLGKTMPSLMRRYRLAGQLENPQRPNDSVKVVNPDSVRTRGIDLGELLVQKCDSALV